MHFTAMQQAMWGADFFGEVALCFVLIFRARWRGFPAFTSLIASQVLADIVMFAMYTFSTPRRSNLCYWTFVCVNFTLQLAVVVEIARIVLRPTGTWVRDARKQFLTWAVGGALVALLCAGIVNPPDASWSESLELRANLFTSLLTLELAIAITLSSNSLGLGWQNHVMALVQGLTLWSVVGSLVDGLHSYLGATKAYDMLDNVRAFAFIAAQVYWIVQFWHAEPERQPISMELHQYITGLHERVRLDLDRVR